MYLALNRLDILGHLNWVGEELVIPHEVLVVFGVFNIEPENVHGYILLIETLLHAPDVVRADIIPAALVVAKGPVSRERGGPGQSGVLSEDVGDSGAREYEHVENARLRDPVCSRRLRCWTSNVDPGFGTNSVKDANRRLGRMRLEEGNRTVQRHGGVREIFEYVRVVQAIGFSVIRILASGGGERKACRVLRDTIDMPMAWEVDVEGQRLRSYEHGWMKNIIQGRQVTYLWACYP